MRRSDKRIQPDHKPGRSRDTIDNSLLPTRVGLFSVRYISEFESEVSFVRFVIPSLRVRIHSTSNWPLSIIILSIKGYVRYGEVGIAFLVLLR